MQWLLLQESFVLCGVRKIRTYQTSVAASQHISDQMSVSCCIVKKKNVFNKREKEEEVSICGSAASMLILFPCKVTEGGRIKSLRLKEEPTSAAPLKASALLGKDSAKHLEIYWGGSMFSFPRKNYWIEL